MLLSRVVVLSDMVSQSEDWGEFLNTFFFVFVREVSLKCYDKKKMFLKVISGPL